MQLLRGLTKRGEPRTERPSAAPVPAPAPAAPAPAPAPTARAAQPLSPASPPRPLAPPAAEEPRVGDGATSPPTRAIRFTEPGTRAPPAGRARDDLDERLGASPSTHDEALGVRRSASDHHIRARAERPRARARALRG
ncbi:hypothetical protein MBRA1_002683 [Malassezia brasiliensis]|uniref:Uncharacterized protein n=1 Tax=Malassezia brasiliensis TaxID=1821822 RepID=A0AAF0DV90_9BASI|nr:hypothetical protein MBRA1_002683 [Malassezia brasiliensis]